MSEANQLKTRPMTSRIPLLGGIVGLALCLLISSACSLSYYFVTESSPIWVVPDLESAMPWLMVFGIFVGPLGAGVGAFVATDLFMTDEAGKKVARTLFRICGGLLGFTLGFWTSAILLYLFFTQDPEEMVLAFYFGPPVGVLVGGFGAAGGASFARYLVNHWPGEESSNLTEGK